VIDKYSTIERKRERELASERARERERERTSEMKHIYVYIKAVYKSLAFYTKIFLIILGHHIFLNSFRDIFLYFYPK